MERAGILITERDSITPLGPTIVFADEAMANLTGYRTKDLIGSPLGMVYDRSEITSLIERLPIIATAPGRRHYFKIGSLVRSDRRRLACRWTIRLEALQASQGEFFVITVKLIPQESEELHTETRSGHHSNPQSSLRKITLENRLNTQPTVNESQTELRISPNQAHVLSEPQSPATPETPETPAPSAPGSESLRITAAGVVHDFKNALQVIRMNLECAENDCVTVPGVMEWLRDAQAALTDAEALAGQMLAFTREESSQKSAIKIDGLIQRAQQLGMAGSHIRCRTFLKHSPTIFANSPQIYQVLHNLVFNARQAMPTGGTIDIILDRAEFGVPNRFGLKPGVYLVLSVTDKGVGISKEDLPHIFDAGFSTKVGGNGIGLASCRAIVQEHGGHIDAASKVGVGTEFLVFLPTIDPVEECPQSNSSAAILELKSAQSSVRAGRGRILVVEDDPRVARSTVGGLRQLGYDSVHASTGPEALALYRKHLEAFDPIDQILLDMTLMGGMSGSEVANELLRLNPNARIIATSGNLQGEYTPENSPYAAVLPKPFGKADLARVLERE